MFEKVSVFRKIHFCVRNYACVLENTPVQDFVGCVKEITCMNGRCALLFEKIMFVSKELFLCFCGTCSFILLLH